MDEQAGPHSSKAKLHSTNLSSSHPFVARWVNAGLKKNRAKQQLFFRSQPLRERPSKLAIFYEVKGDIRILADTSGYQNTQIQN